MATAEKKKQAKVDPTTENVTWAIAWGALEFSKKIISFILVVFGLHVIISLVAILINPEAYTTPMKGFMDSCMPIYLMGVAGYDAKAGMENALKISNQAKQLTTGDEPIG